MACYDKPGAGFYCLLYPVSRYCLCWCLCPVSISTVCINLSRLSPNRCSNSPKSCNESCTLPGVVVIFLIAIFIGIGVQLKSVGAFTLTVCRSFHVPCRFRVLGIVALFVLFRAALLRFNHSRIDNIDRAFGNNKTVLSEMMINLPQ